MLTVCPGQRSALPDALSFGLSYMESDDLEAIPGLPPSGSKDLTYEAVQGEMELPGGASLVILFSLHFPYTPRGPVERTRQ